MSVAPKNAPLFRITRYFVTLIAILLPAITCWYWIDPDGYAASNVYGPFTRDALIEESATWKWVLSAFLSLAATALFVLALVQLHAALRAFEQGAFFTEQTVERFRRIGTLLILYAPASMLRDTLTTLIATLDRPSGERLLSIGFEGEQLFTLLLGLVSWGVAEIFSAARANQQELEEIV